MAFFEYKEGRPILHIDDEIATSIAIGEGKINSRTNIKMDRLYKYSKRGFIIHGWAEIYLSRYHTSTINAVRFFASFFRNHIKDKKFMKVSDICDGRMTHNLECLTKTSGKGDDGYISASQIMDILLSLQYTREKMIPSLVNYMYRVMTEKGDITDMTSKFCNKVIYLDEEY